MRILVKRILKTLLKIYDGFCVMVDFSYELFVFLKYSPDLKKNHNTLIIWRVFVKAPKITGG